jgi:hypothetical protein
MGWRGGGVTMAVRVFEVEGRDDDGRSIRIKATIKIPKKTLLTSEQNSVVNDMSDQLVRVLMSGAGYGFSFHARQITMKV